MENRCFFFLIFFNFRGMVSKTKKSITYGFEVEIDPKLII